MLLVIYNYGVMWLSVVSLTHKKHKSFKSTPPENVRKSEISEGKMKFRWMFGESFDNDNGSGIDDDKFILSLSGQELSF